MELMNFKEVTGKVIVGMIYDAFERVVLFFDDGNCCMLTSESVVKTNWLSMQLYDLEYIAEYAKSIGLEIGNEEGDLGAAIEYRKKVDKKLEMIQYFQNKARIELKTELDYFVICDKVESIDDFDTVDHQLLFAEILAENNKLNNQESY